jgi:hypothetical protein
MRKINLVALLLVFVHVASAQDTFKNNGYNLKSYCDPTECIYFKFHNTMSYPLESDDPDWKMANVEVAVKQSGSYIVTGDLGIIGKDMGAKLNFELQLFDANDQLIFVEQTGLFEFYSEPNQAEPMVFSGELDAEIAEKVDFIDFIVVKSEVLPYYELSSDCYGPCKNHQLNVSIKEFKKHK